MQVGFNNYQVGNSNVMEKADNKNAGNKTEDKYASVSAYQAYLKDKYSCLSAHEYKVRISPAYLQKCIKNPKEAESFEKVLAHIPVSYRFFTAAWNASGAKVVNQEFIFDENGNCGGSPNTYVTSINSSSDNRDEDEIPKKKRRKKKPALKDPYEKRKFLREQFDERLAEKEYLKDQIEEKERKEELLRESILSKERNTERFIERYEAQLFPVQGKRKKPETIL